MNRKSVHDYKMMGIFREKKMTPEGVIITRKVIMLNCQR